MKVTTSCFSRFHIFDQAKQLERLGILERLVTACPKRWAKQWDIPQEKVVSLRSSGAMGWLASKCFSRVSECFSSAPTKYIHSHFSKRLVHHVPTTCDVFIGLSSFCLEAIIHAKEKGIFTVVDHGSMHQRWERQILMEECERWNLPSAGVLPPSWLIEKQDKEFQIADGVIVLSEVAKRTLIEEGVTAEKVMVNNCGVSLQDFSPLPKNDDIFRIIQCSAITPRKGIQYLLKAFFELKLPKSELWLVGNGGTTSTFRSVIDQFLGCNIYFKGNYPQKELRKIYAQGSVLVLPSIADGFGMVVPQAMACGLPVIVTENVGASDIVEDGVNGFKIPIRDVEALKDRLIRLYENRHLLREMSQKALTSVSERSTWDDYGDRLMAGLQERVH